MGKKKFITITERGWDILLFKSREKDLKFFFPLIIYSKTKPKYYLSNIVSIKAKYN